MRSDAVRRWSASRGSKIDAVMQDKKNENGATTGDQRDVTISNDPAGIA